MKLPDLISIIGSLDASKATGLDGTTAKILKSSTEIVCPSLLKIINISISIGIFPECLKQAKVIPFHKSGPYNDPANYRLISILPILSKIIEKHVTKHLFAYLNKYGILHKSQSGFRKNHSCNTALIFLVDKWLNNVDRGGIIGAIFVGLRKAFDVVDHQLLIEKVNSYHFSNNSVNWIRTYLTDRQQCITEKTTRSSFQRVQSGVPQGSFLGPVLFLLFVNDMLLFINKAYVDIYADDSTLYTASKKLETVEETLQKGSEGFKTWCLTNGMYINIGKTSVMTIGTRSKLSHAESIRIFLRDELVKEVDYQKLLGVIIDKTLTGDKQIDAICLNITRRIILLKLLSKYVKRPSLNQYYNAYI